MQLSSATGVVSGVTGGALAAEACVLKGNCSDLVANVAITAATSRLGVAATGARRGAKSDGFCSFAGATSVEMADGSRKAMSDVKVGDEVLATDPITGERGPRKVTHLWIHPDTLLELETGSGTLKTTEDHPFWNATDREDQRADQLDPGDYLLTANGQKVRVKGIRPNSQESATVYNLTVDDLHTYYVVAGTTPVLVHNCNGRDPVSSGLGDDAYDGVSDAFGTDVAEGVDYQAKRMHDGSDTALDHEIPGIGHDPEALGAYFASWRGRMTHIDSQTGARVAYDDTRGVLIVENSYMIHGYQYSRDSFLNGGRYTAR